jgi:lysozyme family protein
MPPKEASMVENNLNATQRFAACLDHVLASEGGYANHPSDPGGATNMGITRKTLAMWRGISPWWDLPTSDVQALSRNEAAKIYKARYWDRCRGGSLPAGLDLALFDYAVNSGPLRAVKELQRICGTNLDGFVGPLTLAAVKKAVAEQGVAQLVTRLCDRRLGFLRRLETFATFGRGWTRRIENVRRTALEMAGNAPSSPQSFNERSNPMNILSGYRTYIAAAAMLIVGLCQLFGIDLPGFDGQSAGQLIIEAFAIFFLRKGLKTEVGNA